MIAADGQRFECAANLSMLYTESPLLDRFAAAAAAGFGSAEAWWPYPDSAEPAAADLDRFIAAVDDSGIPLSGLNFFAGDMPAGERGIVSDPRRVDEFARNLSVMAEIAKRTGIRGANALYGHRIEGIAPDAQDAVAIDNLCLATRTLADAGVTVLVEALAEGLNGPYPLGRAAQVVRVVGEVRERTGLDNVGMILDTFHLASNGEDLLAVIDAYSDVIAHVQLADAPGRGEPGTGDVDFAAVLDRLWERGYRGIVACEYKPSGATTASLETLTGLGLLTPTD
jgi:hydroxypyruvate isomerase